MTLLLFTTFDASNFRSFVPHSSLSACLLSSLLGLFYLPNLGKKGGLWSALLHSWHITTRLFTTKLIFHHFRYLALLYLWPFFHRPSWSFTVLTILSYFFLSL